MQKIKTLKHVVFDILHFDGFEDFFLSIFPSLAVKNVSMTLISLSLIGGVVSKYLGLSMFMLVGLSIALLLELLLGIYVSTQIKKDPFEIKKSRRFIIKCFILVGVLAMGNMFKMGAESELQKIVFYNINDAIVIYSLLEVVVSVFQKRAIFEGKPKNFYSRIIQDKVSKFFGNGPSNDK